MMVNGMVGRRDGGCSRKIKTARMHLDKFALFGEYELQCTR